MATEQTATRPVARRHHWVPRFYLKAFAVPRKRTMQTRVFDRVGRKQFATPIENVAAERDFNRVEIDGMPPDAFESAMAEVESDLSPKIERIRAIGAIHDADDRACLLNLIGLLHLRNPRHRETFRDFQERRGKADHEPRYCHARTLGRTSRQSNEVGLSKARR